MVDRRQKNLFRLQYLVLGIFFVNAILTGALVWGLYTQGFYDKWALTNYILQNLAYIFAEYLVFAILVNINLDFRLQT